MNKILLGVISLLFLCACEKDHSHDPSSSDESNPWIEEVMRSYYLWYEDIPSSNQLNHSLESDQFFNSLLSAKDGIDYQGSHIYFSQIERKESSTKAGGAEYGFEYAIGQVSYQAQKVNAALVLYVHPNSPASEANLRRGDWILGVNSNTPNLNDYSILESGGAATFHLGKYSSNKEALVDGGSKEIGPARSMAINPFLVDSVYRLNNQYTIGYLAYLEFKANDKADDLSDPIYNDQMKDIFTKFKNAGVNEFILDLRFNGGGILECAQLLTSLLAPANALGKTFCTLKANDKHPELNEEYKLLSEVAAINLDLKRIIILTSNSTASASELVINSLIPYMTTDKVLLIGSQTVGKNVGSSTFGLNEKYDWLLHPIIYQAFNANNSNDYGNGFDPGYVLSEPWFGEDFYDLGDTRDELLNAALSVYTTDYQRQTKASSLPMNMHYTSLEHRYPQDLIISSPQLTN